MKRLFNLSNGIKSAKILNENDPKYNTKNICDRYRTASGYTYTYTYTYSEKAKTKITNY